MMLQVRSSITSRPTAALVGLLLLSCLCYLGAYYLPALGQLDHLRNLVATLAASLPFALAALVAERVPRPTRRHLLLLLGGAVALRLCPPLDQLVGSDDAFRYLWDGLVQQAGLNPYLHAPDSAALAHLQEPVYHPHVYRPDMRTVYPPLAQAWFRLAYQLSPGGFVGWKLILLFNDLVSTALLYHLLRRRGQAPLRALVYAWSPLPVVQLMGAGHLDALLVPWCLLSVLAADRGRVFWAGAALGAGAMVRPLLLLCLPALALRRPWRQGAAATAGFAVVCVLLLLPFLDAGGGLTESLLTYARHWRFNGSLFQLAEAALGQQPWVRQGAYAAICLLCVGAALAPLELATRYMLALAAYLILAPTVYPWYLLGIAGLSALPRPRPLLVALPALASFSDLVWVHKRLTGQWRLPGLVLWVEYGLIYGLLLAELVRWGRGRVRRSG